MDSQSSQRGAQCCWFAVIKDGAAIMTFHVLVVHGQTLPKGKPAVTLQTRGRGE